MSFHPSQNARQESKEMAAAVFANKGLAGRFREMAERTGTTEPVADNFDWISEVYGLRRGDRVQFRDSQNRWHKGRALGSARPGHKFPVIPVCEEAEWLETQPPDELAWRAWPIEDVRREGASS